MHPHVKWRQLSTKPSQVECAILNWTPRLHAVTAVNGDVLLALRPDASSLSALINAQPSPVREKSYLTRVVPGSSASDPVVRCRCPAALLLSAPACNHHIHHAVSSCTSRLSATAMHDTSLALYIISLLRKYIPTIYSFLS